jgi:hypothetical protein
METSRAKRTGRTLAVGVLLLGAAAGALAAPPGDKPGAERRGEKPGKRPEVQMIRHQGGEPLIIAMGKGYLGLGLTELSPELLSHFGVSGDSGVMISRVEPGSPAEKAGIEVGDIVTSVDGSPVESTWDVSSRIRKKEEGDQVPVEVWRDRKPQTFTVTIAERERPEIDVSPFFLKRRDGDDVVLQIDPDRMGRRLERFHVEGPEPGEGPPLIRFRSREAELEKRLKELEKRIVDLERQLEKN